MSKQLTHLINFIGLWPKNRWDSTINYKVQTALCWPLTLVWSVTCDDQHRPKGQGCRLSQLQKDRSEGFWVVVGVIGQPACYIFLRFFMFPEWALGGKARPERSRDPESPSRMGNALCNFRDRSESTVGHTPLYLKAAVYNCMQGWQHDWWCMVYNAPIPSDLFLIDKSPHLISWRESSFVATGKFLVPWSYSIDSDLGGLIEHGKMALNNQGLHTPMFWLVVPASLALSDKLTNFWLPIATCEIYWSWRRTPTDAPLDYTSCILSAGYRFGLKSVLQVCGRWAGGYLTLFLKKILTWGILRNNRFFSRCVPIITVRNYGWLN